MNIQEVLEKHEMWLNGEDGGQIADLQDADLAKDLGLADTEEEV